MACESGVNDRRPADELIGLTRALLYAGTSSVLVTLWSVDELSTSLLMQYFYTALRGGARKVEALQQAQLRLMRVTAREVIEYCQAAKGRPSGYTAEIRWQLDRDIADCRFRAGDFEAALDDYTHLLRAAVDEHLLIGETKQAIERCKAAMRSLKRRPIDYEICVYNRMYYWAPYVLVGDWQ